TAKQGRLLAFLAASALRVRCPLFRGANQFHERFDFMSVPPLCDKSNVITVVVYLGNFNKARLLFQMLMKHLSRIAASETQCAPDLPRQVGAVGDSESYLRRLPAKRKIHAKTADDLNRPTTRKIFWPPKPKLLESANSQGASREALGM